MITKQEVRYLLEKSKTWERLSGKQIAIFLMWSVFKIYKTKAYLEQIKAGKSARFAFIYAKNCKKELKND